MSKLSNKAIAGLIQNLQSGLAEAQVLMSEYTVQQVINLFPNDPTKALLDLLNQNLLKRESVFREQLIEQADKLAVTNTHINRRLSHQSYYQSLIKAIESFRYNWQLAEEGFERVMLIDRRLQPIFLTDVIDNIDCKADPEEFSNRFSKRPNQPVAIVQWRLIYNFDPKKSLVPFNITEGLILWLNHGIQFGSLELAGSVNEYGSLPCLRVPNPPYVLESQLGSNSLSSLRQYPVPVYKV